MFASSSRGRRSGCLHSGRSSARDRRGYAEGDSGEDRGFHLGVDETGEGERWLQVIDHAGMDDNCTKPNCLYSPTILCPDNSCPPSLGPCAVALTFKRFCRVMSDHRSCLGTLAERKKESRLQGETRERMFVRAATVLVRPAGLTAVLPRVEASQAVQHRARCTSRAKAKPNSMYLGSSSGKPKFG